MAMERERSSPGTILAPASTAAPLMTALGVTFVLAGLVTNVTVSIVGAVFFVAGAVGWFREVLPHDRRAGTTAVHFLDLDWDDMFALARFVAPRLP